MTGTLHQPDPINQAEFPEIQPWKELAIVSQIVMELAWIVPWYRSLTFGTNQATPARVFIVLFGILIAAYLLARGMNYFRLRSQLRHMVFLVFAFAVGLLALRYLLYFSQSINIVELIQKPVLAFADYLVIFPDEFVIVIVVLFILFRGISIASQITSPRDMAVRFQVGFFMLVFFVAINTLLTDEIPGNFLFVYLFFGLLAIGAARMSVNERMRGGRETTFDRRWLAGMVLSAVVAVLLAIAVTQLLQTQIFYSVLQILAVIGKILVGLLLLLLFPIFLLLIVILDWVSSQSILGEAMPELITNLQNMISQLDGFAYRLLEIARQYLPDISISKPAFLWGGVGIVLLFGLFFVSFQWFTRNYGKLKEDELDSIMDRSSLARIFKYILLHQLISLGKKLDLTLNSASNQKKIAAAQIRKTYRELCELGESLGAIRLEAWTPLEYSTQLEKVFVENADGVRKITLAYNKIRYGEYPENLQEVQSINEIWQKIKREAKEKKGSNSEDTK